MDAAGTKPLTRESATRWAIDYLAHLLDRPAAEIDLYRGLSEYGLDSMDAVVMAGEMEEHFGVEIDPALFLQETTLGELIAQLDSPAREAPG